MASTFRDLRVWQEAMELTVQVYKSTAVFPKVENYGLAQQMQRAAVSVPSNIAEGKGHHSNKEFVHFLLHARAVTLGATDTDSLVRAVNIYLEGTGNPVACDRGEREPRAKRINHLFVRKRVILPTTYDVRRTTIFYVFTP
jgi:hypothetical protein